jgi:mono/diheme cytochrome c family protein
MTCRWLVWALAAIVLPGCEESQISVDRNLVQGDAAAGRIAIMEISCGVCHVIPGVPGARGAVGPSLDGFAQRSLIAGVTPNRPAQLARWVRDAPSIAPNTGMPDLPVSEDQSVNIAAYLYTLR